MSHPTPDDSRIREAAYLLWLNEGQPHGRDEEHWHKAADALTDDAAPKAKAKATPKKAAAKPRSAKTTRAAAAPKDDAAPKRATRSKSATAAKPATRKTASKAKTASAASDATAGTKAKTTAAPRKRKTTATKAE